MAALILLAGGLAMASCAGLTASAQTQTQAPGSIYDQLKQSKLAEAEIKHYIAAQGEMGAAMQSAPRDAADAPDPKVLAKLDEVARKYSFASYDAFNTVAGNIALIVDGIDPDTKKYVGAEAILKQAIANAKANVKLSDADRQEALAILSDEMKVITPVKFPANIELVIKYYDALAGGETQNQ
jgi:hypothetical protein